MNDFTMRSFRELKKSIEEVKKTLPDDKPKLVIKYGPTMRKILEANSFESLFHI